MAIRIVCVLSLVLLLLLALDDAYALFRHRRRRETEPRHASDGEEHKADEKGLLRHHFVESNVVVTDEASKGWGSGIKRLYTAFVTREIELGLV